MIISTRRIDQAGLATRCRGARCEEPLSAASAGFTLTEILVATTLSALVLAGVLSAFLMITRSGFLASSYSELETQTRRGLEIFGQDVRTASNIQWNSSHSITLTVAGANSGSVLTTYAYDPITSSPTYRCFYRLLGDANSSATRQILIRNVASDFAFQRFKLEQSSSSDNTASTDRETKQIQVTLRSSRAGITTVAANQSALSARYILRNKRVSN